MYPKDQPVIDLSLNIPVSSTNEEWCASFLPLFRDKESRESFRMPAQYMFKGIPDLSKVEDFTAYTFEQMDRFNIRVAMMGFWEGSETIAHVEWHYRDRVLFELMINPNDGVDEIRRIRRLHRDHGIDALSVFPCGLFPQVPIR